MANDSMIRSSGQTWKLALGLVLMLAGFVVAAYGMLPPRSAESLDLTLLGMTSGLTVFAATCLTIRCPTCATHWMWTAVREQDARNWLAWLLTQRTCPSCGFNKPSSGSPRHSLQTSIPSADCRTAPRPSGDAAHLQPPPRD